MGRYDANKFSAGDTGTTPRTKQNADVDALDVIAQGLLPEFTCTATEAVGDAVYVSAANTVTQAVCDSATTMPAIGIIQAKPSSTTCYVCFSGIVDGFTGLTPGAIYYVDETAGGITATKPTDTDPAYLNQVVGVAISTTELLVMNTIGYATEA